MSGPWRRSPDEPRLGALIADRGWYPLGILFTLNLVDELDRAVMVVFAPNIRRYFDISNAALGGIVGLQVLLILLVSIPLGYAGTRVNRVRLLRASAAVWAACSALTAAAIRIPFFVAARIGTGIGKAAVEPVGRSLLADVYSPRAWTRVFAVHAAANPLGNVIGPLLAGAVGLAASGDGAWRWAFPLLAIPSVIAVVASRRLAEPNERRVHTAEGTELLARPEPSGLAIGEAVARVMRIPTFARQTVAIGVLGFALVGLGVFTSVLYDEVFDVSEAGRGLIIAFIGTGSLVGYIVGGPIGERVFQRDPATAIRLMAGGITAFALLIGLSAALPSLGLVIAAQWLALAVVSVAATPLPTVLSSVCAPSLRPLVFSLLGVYVALFGGVLGGVLVGAIGDAHGIRWGLASMAPFGVLGGLLMLRSTSTVATDIANVAQEIRDDEEARARRASGAPVRALEVRNLDFSYGQMQVLFDVALDVDDGEIVALLGTNGAGKSTLLRAVCGLDLPTRGSVRCFGDDITWLDAETRVGKGVIQVPGGRSTFPSLTVLENLRTGGYRYRRDKARLDAAVEEVFGYFPALDGRKEQAAGTLSGGEQQMVALGRAFIAEPRLLLIDELSLGLAPVIVEQLLGIVRAFSARGTTLVLVEQSVNVALSVATTAYFMERGEVRFGGPAADLLARDDLLRSVFLEGAGHSLSGDRK